MPSLVGIHRSTGALNCTRPRADVARVFLHELILAGKVRMHGGEGVSAICFLISGQVAVYSP